MEIVRNINNVDILVGCNESHDIYFDEVFTKENNLSNGASQFDICELLTQDGFQPLYLTWEIIDKCNFSCPFCYIVGHSSNRIVRFKNIVKELDVLIENGLLYCLLTGGEVTIHPDFNEIYKYLKENGVIVEVYTNGAQISKELLTLFTEYKPHKVEITIYGLTDKVFNTNTDTTTNFKAKDVLNNIEELHNLGINVVCKTAVNTLTINEFEEIKEWCLKKGVEYYYSSNIRESYDNESLIQFVTPDEIKKKHSIESNNLLPTIPEPVKTGSVKSCFSCASGAYNIHINSNFELQPCSSFNRKKKGLNIQDIGMELSLKYHRNDISSVYEKPMIGCVGCDSFEHCKMCPARGEEVLVNGVVIGYKTNKGYCSKIRTKHKEI